MNGVVVLCDNTGHWDIVRAACLFDVAALERVTGAGHTLKSFGSLMGSGRPESFGDPDALIWYSSSHGAQSGQGRAGWYLAGVPISDEDAAAFVASGPTVQGDVLALMGADTPVTDLVSAVAAART